MRHPIGLIFLGALALASCNLPGREASVSNLDVTGAYQTVEYRLTQAVAETSIPTTIQQAGEETQNQPEESTSTTLESPTPEVNILTGTPIPGDDCDQAAAANPVDITIEDDTEFEPGYEFTKIWRIINIGTCTWTTEYEIVFFSGELMGAAPNQLLTEVVPPSQSVDLAVDMAAPITPGTFQGNWKFQNPNGELFGIGPGGESPFWVRIKVVGEVLDTTTPTPTPSPTAEVQASGSAILGVDDTIDLDSLQINSGGPDLKYRITVVDPHHQLVPLLGVRLIIFGGSEPSLADCESGNPDSSPIILEDFPVGTYLCYRTDLGLPGWVRIDGFNQDTDDLTLQVFTWKLP